MDKEKPSTRRAILDILKRCGNLTVDQLSSHLGITPMGVRQHLAILEKDGLVQAGVQRGGMGRPSYLYGLTDKARNQFPNNYQSFAVGLLEDIRALAGEEMVEALFRRRTERLEESYRRRIGGKTLAERVAELAGILESNGSMASWEQIDAGTFMVTEHNCAIHAVAASYPAACRYELELFERVLDADIERLACQTEGGLACQYIVRQRKSETGLMANG